MIAAAPSWAVWLALGLWVVAIVVCAIAVVLLGRLWRQWQPAIAPLLLAFGLGASETPDAAAGPPAVESTAAASASPPFDQHA